MDWLWRNDVRIGNSVIDPKKSAVKLHGGTESKADENHEEQLRRYERYQRLAFGGIVMSWDAAALVQRLGELEAEAIDVSRVHGRRIRAEREAIRGEIERRRKEPDGT